MRSLWLVLALGLLALCHVQASEEIDDSESPLDDDLSDIDENEEEYLRLLEEKAKVGFLTPEALKYLTYL